MTFYDFLIRHFKKRRKSCFFKSEKTKNTYSRTLTPTVHTAARYNAEFTAQQFRHVGRCEQGYKCKKRLFAFLKFWLRVLRFLNFFYFPNVFFIFLKNVGKVQSGKQINKKHFQNNSNEIAQYRRFHCQLKTTTVSAKLN